MRMANEPSTDQSTSGSSPVQGKIKCFYGQASPACFLSFVVPSVPQLGGDEHVIPLDFAAIDFFGKRLSQLLFVFINCSRIDVLESNRKCCRQKGSYN